MISNCEGCEWEIQEAYKWQKKGYNVILENMGLREHCALVVLDEEGRIIIE